MIPITVNGQQRLFDPELTQEQLQALLADLRIKGNRDGLFTESTEGAVTWP